MEEPYNIISASAYDFDNDGDYDILVLVAETSDYSFVLLEQTSPMNFTYHLISPVDADLVTSGLWGTGDYHIADIDQDGTLDFISKDEVWFDMISPDRIITPIHFNPWWHGEITPPTDLDNDGDLDFFTINHRYTIILVQYDENYQFTFTRLDDENSVNPYGSLISGDYDTDGDIDAMVYRGEAEDPPYLPEKPLVFVNNGGSFTMEEPFEDEDWNPLAIMDGNDDGINDLLVLNASWYESYGWLRVSDGIGGFQEYFMAEMRFLDYASADLDNDGDLDVISVKSRRWYENLLYDEGPFEMDVRWDRDYSPPNDLMIEFDLVLANYDQTRSGAIWADAVTPFGTYRLNTVYPTMHPGEFLVLQDVRQEVPENLPAGDYEYIVSVGVPPAYALESDTLFFHVNNSFTNARPPSGSQYSTHEGSSVEDAPWLQSWREMAARVDWTGENGTHGVSSPILNDQHTVLGVSPNPFNPTTTISINLPESAKLRVQVFNITGQQVAELANGQFSAGNHNLSFNASNMASGLYFVRATVPGQMDQVEKVMLVR
ncbi:MAG TPA: T9SS type A sorting domain-containing protein [Bacteroidetes bacterium]|nr:hypothetical protein BMS3Bbin04_01113 [bacterium BMS3Bbin04]HDO64802.1 T9SS type A sorting domain-containing protein [Bacteroidota bacterium]HEX03927.1 T9SS type A sorting domain-containing protein [Bacteroidota bacterium]